MYWDGTGCCPGTTGAMYAAPRGVAMRGNTIGLVYPFYRRIFFSRLFNIPSLLLMLLPPPFV